MGSKRKARPVSDAPPPREFEAPMLRPMSEAQARFMEVVAGDKPLVFCLGPAGTGKTYITTAMAADALERGDCERIIITRPAVEAGESIGFLPGTLDEKFEPYLAPVKDVLLERLGVKKLSTHLKYGSIRPIPLNFVRGLTLKNCWVLADEMQNATPKEMKMLLTRAGDDSKFLVSGDIEQSDIPGLTGLEDGVNKMRGSAFTNFFEFSESDIVRSGLARDVVIRYRHSTAPWAMKG